MKVFDEIRVFIEREIVPRYDGFDAGHNRDHVNTVISQALSLAEFYPDVDRCLLLVAAAYHDLGLSGPRAIHHLTSGKILMQDARLKRWFSPE